MSADPLIVCFHVPAIGKGRDYSLRMLNKIVSWVKAFSTQLWFELREHTEVHRSEVRAVGSSSIEFLPSLKRACHLYTVAGLHFLYFPVELIIFIVSVEDFSSATQNFTMLRNSTSPIDVMLFTQWLWATTLKQCWSVENLNNVMIFSGNDVMTFRCWPAFSRIFYVIKITKYY